MRSTILVLAAVAAGAVPAHAQSLNIDFNAATGFASLAPSSSFAGSLSQPGTWNAVPCVGPGPYALVGLSGAPVAATLTRTGNAADQSFNSAQTTGEFERLLDDFQAIASPGGSTTLVFTGLIPGNYTLHTHAISPASSTQRSSVVAFPSTSSNPQSIGGTMPANGFIAGTTHANHAVQIRAGDSLNVTVSAGTGAGTLSGLQLRLVAAMSPRIYVDASATGQNNGTDWANAYTSLQTALQNAALSGGLVQEIWVADGVYRPTTIVDRIASFELRSNLAVYGGFAGDETSLAQRNIAANVARLSGQLGGGTANERSYQIVDASNTDRTAILDGFTIELGNANGLSPYNSGAGIYINNGSPTIRNCTFVNLNATFAGAGIYSKFGSPLIVNSRFLAGTVAEGGGIFHNGPNPILILNSMFLGNAAGDFGGAVSIFNAPAVIANCLFSGNTAELQGGGVYLAGSATSAAVTNCTFFANASLAAAGGLFLADNADAAVTNSIFFANSDTNPATDPQGDQLSRAGAGNVFTLERNAVQGWTGSLGGVGNLPLNSSPFVDADGPDNTPGTLDDDARLSTTTASACVDAGRNSALPADVADLDADSNTSEPLPLDLGAAARFVDDSAVLDTGVGPAPVVDLGAYERPASAPPPPCAGDANGDRIVNGADLSVLLGQFNQAVTPGTGADFNADGVVNGADLSVLLGRFNQPC